MIDSIFQTERMYLRKITLDDIDNFTLIHTDPVAMQYYPKTFTRQETQEWIEKILASYVQNGAGRWACHLKETDQFVGTCGLLFQKNIDGKDEVEVGYMMIRKFWNQGLATEAAKSTMEYARKNFGYQRLISLIHPENLPSRRVAEKNGFVVEKEVIYKEYNFLVYVNQLT